VENQFKILKRKTLAVPCRAVPCAVCCDVLGWAVFIINVKKKKKKKVLRWCRAPRCEKKQKKLCHAVPCWGVLRLPLPPTPKGNHCTPTDSQPK
jgi:hypothetical protein